MSGRANKSGESLPEGETDAVDSTTATNPAPAKKSKRASAKRVARAESASLRSPRDGLVRGSSSLGDSAELDGVLVNARRTVAHLGISSSDGKSLVENSPSESGSSAAAVTGGVAFGLGAERAATPSLKLPADAQSVENDSEGSRKSPSPRKLDIAAARSPKARPPKVRSASTSSRPTRLSLNLDKSTSSVSKKKKKLKVASSKEAPEPISISQARLRLQESDSRPVFTKSRSFHVFSTSAEPSLSPKEPSHQRHGSLPSGARDSGADDVASSDVFALYGARRGILRTKSVPYLFSWEIGHLEVDLWLPEVGFVYDHLHRSVWRRKKKKKGSNDVESGLPTDSMLAVPMSARGRFVPPLHFTYLFFVWGLPRGNRSRVGLLCL